VSYDQAARELRVRFTVRSTIATRGYDLMPVDPDPFSKKNEIKVSTMNPDNCCAQIKLPVWATPPWSGGKGRYHATKVDDDRDGKSDEDPIDGLDNDNDGLIDEDPPGTKPLIANIFVDWNGDRVWDTSDNSLEWVLKDGLIAPETFGEDGKYTLGEPFYDLNHDGVRQDGEDFVDSAGKSEQRYECVFTAPEDVAQRFWVRIRLTYAELSNGTIPTAVAVPSVVPSPLSSMLVPFIVPGVSSEKLVEAGIAHSTEDKRAMDKEKGGALFGEVEDYPVRTIPVTKKPSVTEVPPGGEIDYTISFKNPSENVVEGITLVDELPDAVSFKSMVKAPSGITYNSASHTVEGTLDLLPLAEIEITYITEVPETIPPYTLIANCVTIETPTYTDKICSPEVTITEPAVEPCDTALLVEPVESMVEVLLTMKTKLESILRDLDRKKLSGSKLRSEFRRVPYNKFKEIMDTCREPLELCVPEFSQKLEELDKAEKKADSVCHKERKTTCPVRVTEKASEPIELCLGAVIAMILLL
ncbi:DUF11 domain-containing protein, partial [Candidatus Bipolaricaulota bacterium]|nr:DUF11 domain-containing protein [Candidatus Bipolaricaulota bacterium]